MMNQVDVVLYVRTGCPYSARVLEEAEKMGITLTTKNIEDAALEAELVEKGGKAQTPYLVDEAHGVALYESSDIIAHLHAHYDHGNKN